MSQADLEQRVAALEKQMSALRADGAGVRRKDWQRTIGMFTGDEVMEQIFAEGRKIREADRRRASKRRPCGSRGRS
jgi:hypothetical protein